MSSGCTPKINHTKGVYMLVDTSGTYTEELNKAKAIINYLLGTLAPGDTMAVARIDTGSFSEKDIVAKVTFDQRPSVANTQKRAFQKQVDGFVSSVAGSSHTDISGGLLQAVEYLNEAGSGQKYVLIFSDLKEELARGHIRDVPFQLEGFHIVALNVTKLRDDIRDPKNYMQRVDQWRDKTESGGGSWRVINDLERLDNMFSL
ncbi:MAG: VWA domain-containing protein [Deltaproteobacteria bacterium]|nr:VWA domain-containing protein [Deltaproteobacteria bacterium]